ncbi:MAG: hypothetical protein ACRDNF_13100 [Streptosporangiaceae bacterium]
MKSYTRGRIEADDTLVLAIAGDLPTALTAIAEGAGLLDLWEAGQETVAAIRDRHPGAATCAPADWAGLVRDRATAQRTGAILVCAGLAEAVAAEASGIGRDRLLVEAAPAQVTGLLSAGWRVVVSTREEAGPNATAAVSAMACWLGATAVRTGYVTAARRAIDMTTAIKGAASRQGNAPAP